MKEVIEVNQERLMLDLFQYLLGKGITRGISRDQYNSVIASTLEKINNDTSRYSDKIKIKDESFEDIVKNINKENSPRAVGINLERYRGELMAIPTYDLYLTDWRDSNVGWYPRQEELFHQILDNLFEPDSSSSVNLKLVPKVTLKRAKKVAAFFINDIIERYVKDQIENQRWPKQYRDIDRYIFERNIAKVIDEKGTAKLFKGAYIQAIKVVCNLLENNHGKIIISNNRKNMLAYANFIKFFVPEKLKFLSVYDYREYETHNARIIVFIEGNNISFYSSKCVFSDPYGEWSDDYKTEEGSIPDEIVKIMEKRIGEII